MNDAAPAAFRLPEVVRYGNAAAVRLAGEQFLDEAVDAVEFGLAALRESNSVVVALLLAWLRHAQARGKKIRFVDAPADLRNIIDLYGIADILPLDARGPASAWSRADEAGESDPQVEAGGAADLEPGAGAKGAADLEPGAGAKGAADLEKKT